MPLSGNEEMGFAGIPIKKRRFPLFWQSSQPTEASLSLPTANEPEQKGFSSQLQGSAISNDSSVTTSSNSNVIIASSNTSKLEACLNITGATGSSDVSGAAGSSITNAVLASLVLGTVAATSNASCVAVSSTASSVTAGSNASSVIAGYNVSKAAEISNASLVSASCSNVTTIATSVSSLSDAGEKSLLKKEQRIPDDTSGSMLQANSNLLQVKLEEQSFSVYSRSLADNDSKGKLATTGESDNILRKSELNLVGNDSVTLNIGKGTRNQQNIDGKCRSLLHTVSGNPGLSLGLRESYPATVSGNKEHGLQNQVKGEPVSLNLSLSKGESGTQLRSTDVQPNTNAGNMLADRTNWDLNTTMDFWEGPANNDGASQKATHMDDVKPFCSEGLTVNGLPTQRKVLEETKQKAKIMSTVTSGRQYNTEASLSLGLNMPYLQLNPNEKFPGPSAKAESCRVDTNIPSKEAVPHTNTPPKEAVPVNKLPVVVTKPIIKSEPLDDSIKTNSAGVEAKPMSSLDTAKVKSESEKCSLESYKSASLCALNSVHARSIKSEPVHEGNQETMKRTEGLLSQSDEQMLGPLGTAAVPTSTNLSLNCDAPTLVEQLVLAKEIEPNGEGQVVSTMVSPVDQYVTGSSISEKIDNSTSQNKNVEDHPDHCRQKFMDVQLPDSRGTAEGSVSDEEKINLSGDVLEEDLYGSDCESGDNQELAAAMDMEHDVRAEDDFEDGEVREPVDKNEIKVSMCEGHEAADGNNGNAENRNSDLVGSAGDDTGTSETLAQVADDANKTDSEGKSNLVLPKAEAFVNCDDAGKDVNNGGNKSAQSADDAKKTDSEGNSNLVLPKAEAFFNFDDAGKDVNNGGNRSRIINLPRASNLSPPGRTRSISGRTLQSQVGRERLPDVALEGDKFHPRGRDEAYGDVSHRFSRERHSDQPSRNSRISFMRGRGRISSRIDTLRGDRDSEHNFASEFYNGPPEFRVIRHKNASAVSDADLNFSSYNNGQDGAYFGTGRGGRKILNDDSSIYTHLPPRRQSPSGRDGPTTRGLPLVRRVPRNLSPGRCIGEDGSELVGLRHVRGFADEHTEPMFERSQHVRGNREFSSVQRRGLPRIRSKSPTRPRARSPGPWAPLRRRSPDGFGGPLELPHRRSPPMYRTERIRSPDRPCFTGEMVLRRHGSPPFLSRPSNDLRDLDPVRHPRSGLPNRSPSGRTFIRNRRLNIVDPRERNEGDDYFGGPMPSGRFHELGTEANADERRRYVDRRGPPRPFRPPPYNGADNENFDLSAEAGPRSFRFCPEDPELQERGNMREREFDIRIKSRPGNAPRRTRNIEEQEESFRHGGQVWHDNGFEDMSRVKRKRF